MVMSIQKEYDDAANWLPYETAEGGYQGNTWTTCDLLTDELGLKLPNDRNGRLLDSLVGQMPDFVWCESDPYGLNEVQLARFSWKRFCQIVKHERRFFFTNYGQKSDADETLPPAQVLERIFNYADTLDLFVPLAQGTRLYRAREGDYAVLATAQDLGPPPQALANQANRMSPAGIVMFYASGSSKTALRETVHNIPAVYVVGRFETQRTATILDMAKLPEVPSIFEETSDTLAYRPRSLLTFLHQISVAISRPIARSAQVHIDYVPTQVVTEYVRSRSLRGSAAVDGIRYRSAVHPGYVSYVLFADQDNLLPPPEKPEWSYQHEKDHWIKLVSRASRKIRNSDWLAWRNDLDDVDWLIDD